MNTRIIKLSIKGHKLWTLLLENCNGRHTMPRLKLKRMADMNTAVFAHHIGKLRQYGLIQTTGKLTKQTIHMSCPPEFVDEFYEIEIIKGSRPRADYVSQKYIKITKSEKYKGQEKNRKCLNCHNRFLSKSFGNRICNSCKQSVAFKDCVNAPLTNPVRATA